MTRIALVLFVAGSLLTARAESKPNFSGHWELDPKASDFGPNGPEQKPQVVEVIKHEDPVMEIDRTMKGDAGDRHNVVKLRTDGTPVENPLGGGTVKSVTKWQGNKLVTTGEMEGQPPLKETREMDDKGRMITTMEFKTDTESGTVRLVFIKK